MQTFMVFGGGAKTWGWSFAVSVSTVGSGDQSPVGSQDFVSKLIARAPGTHADRPRWEDTCSSDIRRIGVNMW